MAALPQSQVHVTLYVFIIAGVVAGVGSAVVVLLLIMVVLTGTASIAVVKSCKRKGEYHFRLAGLPYGQYLATETFNPAYNPLWLPP